MTVSVEQRRRLLVERQMLDNTGRAGRSIGDVAGRLALLHSTDPAVPYLSLHARTDAAVSDIADALYLDRSLFRITTVRRTVFVMPLDVVPLAVGAYNPPLASKLRRQLETWLAENSDDVLATDIGGAADFLRTVDDQVVEHLRTSGPTTGAGLSKAVTDLQTKFDPMPGASYSKPIRITSKVLEILAAEGRIVRAAPAGDLTSGAWTWAAIDDWLPDGIDCVPADEALAGLVERYLASFGPATVTDITWWTGLTKTAVRSALEATGAVAVELEASPEPGYVNARDDLAVDAPSSPVVALLPGLDSTTMGWKQRSWYVDDRAEVGVFDKNGNAGPTVWVDGAVVGVWTQRGDGEVVTELADELATETRHEVDAEATRIARWLGDVRVNWRYPTSISKRLEA